MERRRRPPSSGRSRPPRPRPRSRRSATATSRPNRSRDSPSRPSEASQYPTPEPPAPACRWCLRPTEGGWWERLFPPSHCMVCHATGGVHCEDCHRTFADRGSYSAHLTTVGGDTDGSNCDVCVNRIRFANKTGRQSGNSASSPSGHRSETDGERCPTFFGAMDRATDGTLRRRASGRPLRM